MQPAPPCPAPTCLWRVQASVLLLHWGSYPWARNLWVLINYLFLLPVMLPSVLPRVSTDLAVSVSCCLETSLFLRLPSRDGAPSLPLLSLFLSFIFFPTSLRRKWAAFLGAWCPLPAFRSCFVEFTQRLNVLLMNLWGRNWSPHPIPPPSYLLPLPETLFFWGSKITEDGDCSHEIKRCLLLGRKAMTNLDSMLKSRYITWLTKVHLVKALVFPVVMYGCESWTIKKAKNQRIDAFELWCCRRPLRVPWIAKGSNQSILKGISTEYSLEEMTLKIQYFGHLMWRTDSFENTLMLGRLKAGGKGDDRGWDDWIHQWLNGHEIEQALGVGDEQGSLAWCSPWGCKESVTTERLKWLQWLHWTSSILEGAESCPYWSRYILGVDLSFLPHSASSRNSVHRTHFPASWYFL